MEQEDIITIRQIQSDLEILQELELLLEESEQIEAEFSSYMDQITEHLTEETVEAAHLAKRMLVRLLEFVPGYSAEGEG